MKKTLLATTLGFIYASSTPALASDLDIFSSGEIETGKTVISLMLDRSGSMDGSLGNCPGASYNNRQTENKSFVFDNETFTYSIKYYNCTDGTRGETKMGQMKEALIQLFRDEDLVDESGKKIHIGLGFYPSRSYSGVMDVPAKPMDIEHRKKLLRAVTSLSAGGGTPLAKAYAEAGAYMMGTTADTTVKRKDLYPKFIKYNNGNVYRCNSYSGVINTNNDLFDRIVKCNSQTYFSNPNLSGYKTYTISSGTYYYDNSDIDTYDISNKVNNFKSSSADTKDGTVYKKPAKSTGQCGGGGAGIYLMTDGQPNSSTYRNREIVSHAMNKSLNSTNSIKTLSRAACDTIGSLSRGSNASGWGCSAQYSKLLRNTSNPRGETILTATAGFGSLFSSIGDTSTYQEITLKDNDGNILYNKDGSPKKEKVPDCSLISNQNAQNLCLLGSKASEYGKGGTYYVNNGSQLLASIRKFASDVNNDSVEIETISTGTFSLPIDPVNAVEASYDIYLPLLEPNVESGNNQMWLGNLKKYTVKNGTIKGTGGKVIATDGKLNDNTKDFWNKTTDANDGGDVSKGGVRSNIFDVKTVNNGTSTITQVPDRKIFVENTSTTAGCENTLGLQGIRISKLNDDTGKPVKFDCLDTSYTDTYKQNLVNFLGYKVNGTTKVQDGQLLKVGLPNNQNNVKFDASYKTHGAVLHSIPQMITKKVTVLNGVSQNRTDYMLYGSFDGSLRAVDRKSGREVFTFIPKAILENQGEYLVPNGSGKSKVHYGVDAPWSIYSDFNLSVNNTGVTATAKQIIASGGLRMGGSEYYALDLTNMRKPRKIFTQKVGNDYGPLGKGTDTSGDYGRMGQTWGKPATAFVKVGGKKTMVQFLPGGYDVSYESGDVVTGNKRGNAVYMVQIGSFNGNGKVTYTNAGKRLWWASSNASNTTGTKVADMTDSVVSEIVPLDRDDDGLTDHIYYADLGGKVYRADIDNSGNKFNVVRVVKVLDVSDQKANVTGNSADKTAPRFYESPLVTFMRWDGNGVSNNQIVAVVSVGSGNRSKPLLTRGTAVPDRIYTFIDQDIARNDSIFSANKTLLTKDLSISNLASLEFDITRKEIKDGVKTVEDKMKEANTTTKGWYFDIKHWDGDYSKVINGMKMVNPLNAVNGILYFTTFNPNEPSNTTTPQCGSSIKGESQRDTLCLPYGSCAQEGKYTPINAGLGIVGNTFGRVNVIPQNCNGNNCKPVKPLLSGIIKNDEFNCSNPNDADYNPNNACFSTGKNFFPRSWTER